MRMSTRGTRSLRTKVGATSYLLLERRDLLATYSVNFDQLAPTDYSASEILVRFKDGVDADSLKRPNSVEPTITSDTILTAPLGDGFRADHQLWEIPVLANQSVEELVNYYNGLEVVDYAEPNYLLEARAVPNDQFYGLQWGFDNIAAESAWDTRTDSSSVIVGIIDSGVQYDHPDLAGNIWTNPGEIPGNGIDDDGNGYVDDYYGYDFDNEDSDPMDDNGHGTHVAGTVGAQSDNNIGVAGVGWDASLMSLKVIGGGTNADVARAIDYATDNGAQITNNSYGYAGQNVGGSNVISGAIGRAKAAGVLYVVAAGNSRTNIPASDIDGSFNSWPAEYSKIHDNVITVGAIDEAGTYASYSHWGDESVQIAAPGTQIASTYTGDRYVYLSGTSMAAPHVAGAAALLWAEQPSLTYLEIKDAILDTARPEHLDRVTNGVLDLGAAMASITSSTNSPPVATNDSASVDEDQPVFISVLANDFDPDGDTVTVSSFTQPSNGSVSNNNGVLTYQGDSNFNGSDSFTYTITDGNGNFDTASVSVTVGAVNDRPIANNDSATTDQEVPVTINVLANDLDPDGDSLAIASVGSASNGNVTDNGNGTVTYTPNPGFFGSDSFTYVVTDGDLTDSATVNITVNPVSGLSEIGYSGIAVDIRHTWTTITLPISFNNPVVVAGGATRDGGHQGNVRIRNVTSNSFQIRFQEWDYLDGSHTTENIGYMVVEAGIHTLTDGTQLVAGTTSLTNEAFQTVSYPASFSAAPLVIGQISSDNDTSAVVERIRNVGSNSFQVQMQEEEAADGIHATETFSYIAIDQGTAQSDTTSLNAVTTGNTVTQQNTTVNFGSIGQATTPVILTDMQTRDGGDTATLRIRSQSSTSVTLFVEEEKSRDNELSHTTEVAGVLAIEPGLLMGETQNGTNSESSNDSPLQPILESLDSRWTQLQLAALTPSLLREFQFSWSLSGAAESAHGWQYEFADNWWNRREWTNVQVDRWFAQNSLDFLF